LAATILDLTGLKCPLPALLTGRALRTMSVGEILEVHCTDPMAAIDIPVFVQQSGDRIDHAETRDTTLVFVIRKLNAAIAKDD